MRLLLSAHIADHLLEDGAFDIFLVLVILTRKGVSLHLTVFEVRQMLFKVVAFVSVPAVVTMKRLGFICVDKDPATYLTSDHSLESIVEARGIGYVYDPFL